MGEMRKMGKKLLPHPPHPSIPHLIFPTYSDDFKTTKSVSIRVTITTSQMILGLLDT